MGDGLKKARAAAKATRKPEPKKSEQWRQGYQNGHREGVVEGIRMCGNCRTCYGKGYSTSMAGGRLRMLPCVCERGKQFQQIMNIIEERTKQDYEMR